MNNQQDFLEAANELASDRLERSKIISHPKHLPMAYLHEAPTDYVVVILHGLHESPFYLKGAANFFYGKGFNVVVPLLAKHWAVPLDEINKAQFQEWMQQYQGIVSNAHKLGKKVILAGHSLGGLLAVQMAILYPEQVDGLVLWAPALALTYSSYYGSLVGALSHGWVNIDYNKMLNMPSPHPERVPYFSPFAGREVSRLIQYNLKMYIEAHNFFSRPYWSVKRSMYSSIKVPVFLVSAKVDEVIDGVEVNLFFESLSGPKEHLILPKENHVSLPKGPGDFEPGLQRANKVFGPMLESISGFLDKNFSR